MVDKLREAAEAQLAKMDEIVQNALVWPRRVIRLLVALIILIVIGGSYFGLQEHNQADAIQSGAVKACQYSNEARKANVVLWDGLLNQEVQADTAQTSTTAFKDLSASIAALPASDPDTAAIQQFFEFTFKNTSGPALDKEVQAFKTYIAEHETQQNCQQSYGG